MSKPDTPIDLSALKRPARLTLLGLWAERITHAFWPLWTVLLAIWTALALGAPSKLPLEAAWAGIALAVAALIVTAFKGIRRFRAPKYADALNRIDVTMPGRPVTAALDTQAIGATDEASQAIWQAHKARMQARLAEARAVDPDLRVSKSDPFALRYTALLFFVMAVGFGSLLRSGSLDDLTPGLGGQAIAAGPAWEIWIEPPAYTGKPSLYLNDVKVSELEVPHGSDLTVRLYGQLGSLTLNETVSGIIPDPEAEPQSAFTRKITQSGSIAILDEAEWQITTLDDAQPTVAKDGEVERKVDGEMALTFTATDDYGIEFGTATISLDLASVDRRYGLTIDPEPQEQIVLDLPMPISGNRAEFTETLIENLSLHPWAALPVTINLDVTDASEQTNAPAAIQTDLPGKRFFQPIARALIEQRRDLLWSRDNAKRITQVLRTITHDPEGYFPSEVAFLTTRMAITRLELAHEFGISDDKQAEIAEMLWRAATLLEDGRLDDARERLRRAQERLSEAMEQGATSEEIAELMQELSEAMRDLMEQLAQEGQEGEQQQQAQGEGQEISNDQLQEMLDEIQRLMEEGRNEEAQALLDQLMEMMENMQVTQGQRGQGEPSPGEQAMEGLQDTLREQQGLSDEAFRDLQEQFNPGAQVGENEGNEGRNGGQGRGQSHEGGGDGEQGEQQSEGQNGGQGQNEGSLADRQQALRDELNRQQRNMPGGGTPEGDAARDALDRAGEAMDRAEDALRDNETAEALGAQSDAMEALREGMRNLGEAMAQQQQEGQGQQGQNQGRASGERRDPLGREQGQSGMIGSEENMLQGEDARRRSRDLLDEIRRRSGEQTRPELERDYLKRLLDQF